MARDEDFDWIDDAFNDDKPAGRAPEHARASSGRDAGKVKEEYDWIDDAFDDSKQDPLAKKGMTGCSSFTVALCVIVVLVLLAAIAFILLNSLSLLQAATS